MVKFAKRLLEKFKKKRLERKLAEGYKAYAEEHLKICEEFKYTLLDGLE